MPFSLSQVLFPHHVSPQMHFNVLKIFKTEREANVDVLKQYSLKK